jgi:serine/threonine protein kinase
VFGSELHRLKAVEIIRQISLALDAAHSAGIIHRDLKPQNVMMDKQGNRSGTPKTLRNKAVKQ